MEYSIIILKKIIVMFIYMGIGCLLFKNKLLDIPSTKKLSNILVYVIMPCTVFKSFLIEKTSEGMSIVLQSFLGSLISFGIGYVICSLIYRKDKITKIGTAFPNAGFIGVPLIEATLGSEYVFNSMPFIMVGMVFQYVSSSLIFSKKKDNFVKGLVLNPIVLSTIIGLLIYVFNIGIKIPETITQTIIGLNNVQTPLAMILVGTYLAQVDFKHLKLIKDVLASLLRLIVLPVIVFVIYKLLPFNPITVTAMMICTACPIGMNTAIYAQMFDGDYIYACEIISVSTILSAVVMPIMMMLIV